MIVHSCVTIIQKMNLYDCSQMCCATMTQKTSLCRKQDAVRAYTVSSVLTVIHPVCEIGKSHLTFKF